MKSLTLTVLFSFILLKENRAISVAGVSVIDPCSHFSDAKYTYVNGKCFVFYDNDETTFDKAQAQCQKQFNGGTLAEPRTAAEVDALVGYLRNSTSSYYIGLTDRHDEGYFRWLSTNESTDFYLQYGGNPDNFSAIEDYVEIYITVTFELKANNRADDHHNHFICQQEVPNPCNDFLPGSELFDGKCFLLVDEAKSLKQAQAHCREFNSFLAEPKSAEVNAFLKGMAERYYVEPDEIALRLGGTKSGGTWIWRASNEELDFDDWFDGSPQVGYGSYLAMMQAKEWQWQSLQLTSIPFICQRDIGEPCEEQFPGAIYDSGQCWKFFETKMNFDEAQSVCEEHGAFIAEPKTQELSDALSRSIMSQHGQLLYVWLGCTDEDNEANYRWITSGEPLDFSQWDTNEPDNRNGIEHHVLMNPSQFWFDIHKNVNDSFVCQKAYDPNVVQNYVAVVPSSSDDTEHGVLHVTTGFLSHSVYLRFTIVNGSTYTRSVAWTKSLEYKIDQSLKVTSTGIAQKYVAIKTSNTVTVVLVIKHGNNMGSALLYALGTITGKNYFIPSSSKDEYTGTDKGSTLAVLARQYKKTTNVTIYSPNHHGGSGIIIDDLKTWFSGKTLITGILDQTYEVLMTTNYVGMNGAFVMGDMNVNVLVRNLQEDSEGAASESTSTNLDSVLPVELTAKDYIIFSPLMFPFGGSTYDIYRFVAIHEDTSITVTGYQVQWSCSLASPGDVMDFVVQDFYSISIPRGLGRVQGSKSFYLFKLPGAPDLPMSCMMSMYPKALWRYQYDVAITSDYEGYDVIILVVADTYLMSLIRVSNLDPYITCFPNKPENMFLFSNVSGCYFHLPSEPATYHIYLTNHVARFGAYLQANNNSSASCHALGYQDASAITEFDTEKYLSSYWSDPCKENITTSPAPEYNTTPNTQAEATTEVASSPIMTTTETYDSTIYKVTSPSLPWKSTTPNTTFQEAVEDAKKIGDSLHVDYRSTSAFKRTKISVLDKRVSSTVIGVGGIAFVVSAVSLLVCFDLCNLMARRTSFRRDE